MSDSGFFQITASSLSPRACEILYHLRVESLFLTAIYLGFPKVSSSGLQSQMFRGLIFLVQEPWHVVPDMWLSPLAPLGGPLQL